MWSSAYIDAASLEAVLSGLMKRNVSSLNVWERRALLDLTTVFLTHVRVNLPVSLGARASLNSYPPDIELIKSILRDSLSECAPSHRLKALARAEADLWISLHAESLVSHYRSLWNTSPATDLLHFQMSHTLSYDARRLGGLIDSATLKHVSQLFDWPHSDYRDVAHYVTDTRLLDTWKRCYSERNQLSAVPSILLEASFLGCVVRGRYYTEIARLSKADGIWHPTRDYLSPYKSPFLAASCGLKYVVGMIIVGAIHESNSHDVCECWATNIKRAKIISLESLNENDQVAAENAAIAFAKHANLLFRSTKLERILDLAHEFLITPLLLAAGFLVHVHAPGLSPEGALETLDGPVRAGLLKFAENQSQRVYGEEDNYRDLVQQGKIAFLQSDA